MIELKENLITYFIAQLSGSIVEQGLNSTLQLSCPFSSLRKTEIIISAFLSIYG
jgi:hypothetical protein